MAADTLVSVGVLISGVVIEYTHWYFVDPIIGIVVAIVILYSTWGLLHDSLRLSLDGVPVDINLDEIKGVLLRNEEVEDVHHLHYLGYQHYAECSYGTYCRTFYREYGRVEA